MHEPLFIFGSPRSGTSLVSRLLNAHPSIGIPYESLIYSTFWPIRSSYGDLAKEENLARLVSHMLAWKPVASWEPTVSLDAVFARLRRSTFHGAFEAIMQAWVATQNKPRWGEKSPWHAFYWRELLQGFPEARVIHVLRDARDATLSWKQARQGPRNAAVLARRWASYQALMHDIQAGWPKHAFHELRYEALLEDPERELKAMCAFLDAPFTADLLRFYEGAGNYTTDDTNRLNLGRPILKNNAGKWEHGFSDRELRLVEHAAGEQMRTRGYVPRHDLVRIGRFERLSNDLIEHPLSRLRGMLEDRQGQKEGFQKLWFPIAARLGMPRTNR